MVMACVSAFVSWLRRRVLVDRVDSSKPLKRSSVKVVDGIQLSLRSFRPIMSRDKINTLVE